MHALIFLFHLEELGLFIHSKRQLIWVKESKQLNNMEDLEIKELSQIILNSLSIQFLYILFS